MSDMAGPYPFTVIARWFSFELEVLMRHNFGEQYHTVWKVIGHVLWLSGLATVFYIGISVFG